MRYLVSTIEAILLMEDDKILQKHPRKGRFYGVTWNQKSVYVIFGERLYTLNPSFGMRARDNMHLSIKGPGPHQILYDPEVDRIFVTNTRHNNVRICDTACKQRGCLDWTGWNESHNLLGTFEPDAPRDINHINSIWCDGRHYWVCEHNRGPSCVKRFSKEWRVVAYYQVGERIHNVYVEDGLLYTCSSACNAVIQYDINKKEEIQKVSFSHVFEAFPRGMARSKDYLLIGLSNKAERKNRAKPAPAAVAVLDNNLKIQGVIDLANCSQVLEIRIIDEVDFAHNQLMCPYEKWYTAWND